MHYILNSSAANVFVTVTTLLALSTVNNPAALPVSHEPIVFPIRYTLGSAMAILLAVKSTTTI